MADVAHLQNRMTPDEYLTAEAAAEHKSEYVNGWLFGMAGTTNRHAVIAGSLTIALGPTLKRSCQFFLSDTKVRIRKAEETFYYYPDFHITCGGFEPGSQYNENPVFICEVLSPSTARADRREKFDNYKTIPTLQEYMLIDQDIPKVELFRRSTGWVLELYTRGHVIHLDSIGQDLAISDLYARVDY